MSRNIIFVLMHHRYKLLGHIQSWTVTFGVRWPGHVAIGVKEYIEASGKETSWKLLGRPRVKWENNFKIELMETGDDIGGRWD
jgi:hypothetical protein